MIFNTPAPENIVRWYRKGVPGGGQKDRIFDRLKAKLTGGTDDSGTSYFKMHDRQLSDKDANVIIANMKQDEDGYPMLETGSTSGEDERKYQEWLIDRYLVSSSPSNTTSGPKDVAVELQVVEVPAPPSESDKPEPLRVTIEAPFVAKKYIKLPRRRSGGIVYRGATKEVDAQEKIGTAQRMGEAFENNLLGPIIKSIQDPDENTTPAKKREVARTLITRKQRSSAINIAEETPQGENLASFLGAKVGESFSMAAKARRADKGLKKKSGFYLKKSLTNQFGGDLANRTKGYFSGNPDDTQDPALSRSQRFTASVRPFMNEQGPLSPQVQGPERSGIPGAFDKVAARIDELIDLKRNKSKQSQIANEIQQIEVKNATEEIKENNDLKKKSTEIQKDFISFSKDQESDNEISEIENTSEERNPMADTEMVDNSRPDEPEEEEEGGGGGLLDTALDFFTGSDIAGDIGERVAGRVGRRGAGRAVTRTAIKLGGKKLAKTAAVKVTQSFIKKAALGLMRPLIKRIPLIGGLIDFAVSLMLGEPLGRAAAKAVGATLGGALGTLIPVPFAGTILGGFLGDMVGGAVYDALTGGSGGGGPSKNPESKEELPTPEKSAEAIEASSETPAPPEKLASGGVMAGEAGPESVFSLSSTQGRKVVDEASSVDNTGLSALPFILGITSQVTSLLSGPVKPFIQQKIGTLERLFGLAKFNITKLVGDGMDSVKSVGQNLNIEIPGTNTKGGGNDGVDSQETMNGSTPVTGIPLGEGDTATGKQLHSGLVSRGFSKEEAAAIVGNLWAESGFDSGARNPSGAYGLMQWKDGRYDRLQTYAAEKGKAASDLELQLDYIAWELKGGNPYETAQFNKGMAYGPSVADKTKGFAHEVERARADELASSMQKRVGAAQSVYNAEGTAPPPRQAPAAPPTTSESEEEPHVGPVNPEEPPSQERANEPTHPSQPAIPVITAPMPTALAESNKRSNTTVQPIIIKGSSAPVGYLKTINGSEGRVSRYYYDKKGEKSSLPEIKSRMLQNN